MRDPGPELPARGCGRRAGPGPQRSQTGGCGAGAGAGAALPERRRGAVPVPRAAGGAAAPVAGPGCLVAALGQGSVRGFAAVKPVRAFGLARRSDWGGQGKEGALPPEQHQPALKSCIKVSCDLKAFSNGVFSPLLPAMNVYFAEFTEGMYRLYYYKILLFQLILFPEFRFKSTDTGDQQ